MVCSPSPGSPSRREQIRPFCPAVQQVRMQPSCSALAFLAPHYTYTPVYIAAHTRTCVCWDIHVHYIQSLCVCVFRNAETKGLNFHRTSEFFRSSLLSCLQYIPVPISPFSALWLNCLNSTRSSKNLLKKISVFHISISFCPYLAPLATFASEILLPLVVSRLGCTLVYREYRVGTQGLDSMILVGFFQIGYSVILWPLPASHMIYGNQVKPQVRFLVLSIISLWQYPCSQVSGCCCIWVCGTEFEGVFRDTLFLSSLSF